MSALSLFTPLRLGRYQLAHRIIMPPLTRMRASADDVPGPFAAEYYGQRASSGGLIIAEATQATPYGKGYPGTPGIYSAAQVAAWKKVTDAVHARGGFIFLQIWHVGRSSHSSLLPGGVLPVGPSAIPITGLTVVTRDGETAPYETPRALERNELPGVIESFRHGARNAMAAGFDGVEVHGANGYLLEQFLHDSSNQRSDDYGGSIENRARLLIETTRAVVEVCGADRVGVRLSPFGVYNDVGDSDPIALYRHVLGKLAELDIAYLSLIEARSGAGMEVQTPQGTEELRPFWPKPLILAGGFTSETAEAAIAARRADAIGFGRAFIANPDLVRRLKAGAPLNAYHRKSFYGGGAAGYVDYPFLQDAGAVASLPTRNPVFL